MIGQRLGQYRVTRKIAQGGMGVVYEAHHEHSSLRAAVKVMFLAFAQDAARVERFMTEGKLLAEVQHPGLVRLFDFGQLEDGTVYMMMEYLEGQTLRSRLLEAGKLQPVVAMALVRQLAGALEVVHHASIIHRDLTPANVMLVADAELEHGERAKVLDFGIAKFIHDSSTGTAPGTIIGTVRYMSPEQCSGMTLGPPSDVYSLGVIFFEVLTGVWPYDTIDGTPEQAQAAHREQKPLSLHKLLPEVSTELVLLIEQMLDKDPTRRPSMAKIAKLLRTLQPSSAPRASSGETSLEKLPATSSERSIEEPALRGEKPRRRSILPIAFGATIIVGGALLWKLHGNTLRPMPVPPPPPPPPRDLAVPPDLMPPPPPPQIEGMIHLASGSYMMGSTPDEISAAWSACTLLEKECRRDVYEREQPRHRVTVRAFYLDETEVTNQRYARWLNMKSIDYTVKDGRSIVYENEELLDVQPLQSHIIYQNGKFVARAGFENRPVNRVTWLGATQFCQSAGRRLPTEEEWEYAARGGGTQSHPWGDEPPRCDGVAFGHGAAARCAPPWDRPPLVGTMAQDRTPQGVFDLAGNVSEWVQDVFVERYAASPPRVDVDGAGSVRVVRGGSYLSILPDVRAAVRSRLDARSAKRNIGFRCALSADSPVQGS